MRKPCLLSHRHQRVYRQHRDARARIGAKGQPLRHRAGGAQTSERARPATKDDGVELLAEYKAKIAKLNKVKAGLVNAQNLFNLDVKPYPDLQQTIVDIEKLSKIYDLYSQFKDFQRNMSSMLWGDL
eukprot:gene4051-biopygen3607